VRNGRARSGLAGSYHAAGQVGRARLHWQQALALFSALGTPEADHVRERLAQTSEP
jgi:Flp pilus assembly protein TadD